MPILTFITEYAAKTAKIHNRLNELQTALKKIYESQSYDFLVPLSDNRFFKKGLGGYRALFSCHKYSSHTVLCIFKFSTHDEYLEFSNQVIRNTTTSDKLYNDICDKNHLDFEKCITEFEHNSEPPKLPEPSEEERFWLNCGSDSIQQVMVLETDKWMKAQSTNRFMRSGNAIHKLLQEKVYISIDSEHKSDSKPSRNTTATYLWPAGYIDGADFRLHLQYFPDHHILFLSNITELSDVKQDPLLDRDSDRQTLLRMARRAYPIDVFLLDSEDFAKIQSQQEGNLALSPEESNILSNINGTVQNRFPLFINGRAGSGKSTILHYILKDYLYLNVELCNEYVTHTPLYLTYSQKLLDLAKKHVDRLLVANANILIAQKPEWENSFNHHKALIFNKTFQLFHEFLLKLLPNESRKRFIPECRIGYVEFKQQWSQTAARENRLRRYSADLVWHVLRTYIKGMARDIGDYFDSDSYKRLPRKYKTVSDDDFVEIYRWWNSAYRQNCDDNNLWDDQDLALAVLEETDFPTTYPAIFCDEAQDFTAIELKIIYRLSLFSARELPSYYIGHVPFVFAGDPLQTLNPTGFRWEAVKSSFHEYLLAPTEKRISNTSNKCEFNYQELSANYRSIKKIVNFCNYIQLLRLCLFENSLSIKPQIAWFDDDEGVAPFICPINTPEAENLLRCNTLVIIPNCHEDELREYVVNDQFLKATVKRDEIDIPSTVLSPNMAKGLEYDEIVVLYRFGSTCPPTLIERLQGKGSKDPGAAVTIEWEYFLNRLYVAASRAKKRLIILDDPEAIKLFWGIMREKDAQQLVETLSADVDYQEWGGDRILMLRDGSPGDINGMLEGSKLTDNPAELAAKWHQEGLDACDSGLLRRACTLYEGIEIYKTKAKECKAYALWLESAYSEAAKIYSQIGDQRRLLDCLWAEVKFGEIAKTDWQESMRGDLRVKLALKLSKRTKSTTWDFIGNCKDAILILRQIKTELDNKRIPYDAKEAKQGWSSSIKALLNWVVGSQPDDVSNLLNDWETLNILAGKFHTIEDQAKIAYKMHKYAIAMKLWEEIKKTTHDSYHECEYKVSTWPQTLKPLKQLRDFKRIISDWETQNKVIDNLEELQASILVEALIETGDLSKSVNLLSRQLLVKTPAILKLLTDKLWKRLNKLSANDATETIVCHLKALIGTRAWSDLSKIFDEINILIGKSNLTEANRNQIYNEFVEFLSYSEMLDTAAGESLDVISQLLRSLFHNNDTGWLSVIEYGIKVQFIGTAIERANRIDDAIDFYYWMLRIQRLRPNEYRYLEERLSACLQKRVEWRQRQGKPVDEDERKIRDTNHKLGISAANPKPDPDAYPGDGVLPRYLIELILEKKRLITPIEISSKQKLDACNPNKDKSEWLEALKNYVQVLAENDRWYDIAENWCLSDTVARRYHGTEINTIEEALDAITCKIIDPLSKSDYVVSSSTNTQKILLEFLIQRLMDDEHGNNWSGCNRLKIDHDTIGAAIERLGRHKDGIQFYEWALANTTHRAARFDIAKRLIAVRERYACYLSSTHPEQSQAQKRQSQDLREKYELRNVEIPIYPIVSV